MLHLGREVTVKALGREWTLSRASLGLVRAFRDWVKGREADPPGYLGGLPEEYFRLLPKEEQLERVKRAESVNKQLRGFTLGCPLAKEHLGTEEGAAAFLRLLLLEHHPDVTDEIAFAVAVEAGEQLQGAFQEANGKLPGGGAGNS